MASSINFPKPSEANDWREWAHSFTAVVQAHLGQAQNNPNIGMLVLFSGKPPQGVLPATGVTFDTKLYPILAQQLRSNKTPVVTAPTGLTYGVIAG